MINNSRDELIKQRCFILNKVINKRLNQKQAAMKLWIWDRQVRNLLKAYKVDWEKWLIHWLTWKESNNRLDKMTEEKIKYVAWLDKLEWARPKFIKEKLEEDFHVKVSKETVRKIMINENLRTKRENKRRSEYRKRRPRRLYYWEMSQFDWSYHQRILLKPWEVQCLLMDIDDATWMIMYAKLCENEWFEEVSRFRQERILLHWAPRVIYTDGFSTYKPSASPYAIKQWDTMPQFSRIMNRIWTEIIITQHWPQCKWRIERNNGILQDRLVHELRYEWINNVEDANKFIKEVYIPKHNKMFSVIPAIEWDVHIKLTEEQVDKIKWLFAKRYERSLSYDYIIQYMNSFYQIRKSHDYTIFPKKRLIVWETIEGEIWIFNCWNTLTQMEFEKLDTWNVRMKRVELFWKKDKERLNEERMRKESNRLMKEKHLEESKERKYHYQAKRLLEKKVKFDQWLFDWIWEIWD